MKSRTIVLAVLVSMVFLGLGCHEHHEEDGHKHSDDHPAGHDHHAEGHGHGDHPIVPFTLWSPDFELFGEYNVGVPGEEIEVLLHVTTLRDFRAVVSGTVTIELDGPSKLRGHSARPIRPGIYHIKLTPKHAGTYRGRLRITGEVAGVVDGLELSVFATEALASKAGADHDDHGLIEFLKEQQWGVPFATAEVAEGSVATSVETVGRIATPPGGMAEVGPPVTGRLVVPPSGFPRPGTAVRKGELLASLMPAPSSPEAGAETRLAVVEAQARASAARTALARALRLAAAEAISQRVLEDAKRESRVAKAAVGAARRAAALFLGARGSGGREAWRLEAPIDGIIVSVSATPGAMVSPGDTLFSIVDTRELWVIARVPEQDAVRLRADRGAAFKVLGLDTWMRINIGGEKATDSLVTIGRTVEPISRTVEVIYSLSKPAASLRVGGSVQVSVPVGAEFRGVVISRSAIIDQDGRSIVYIQVDGEHFQERQVVLGPRSGDLVGIREGLKAGDRIVTKGSHLVRLAERANDEIPQGHIH
jgi:RND family efflux transporter MFP subunit